MRNVTINISVMSGHYDIDMTLPEFLAEVTAGLAGVPTESRDTVRIIIEQGGGYEGSEINITLQYTRPETTENALMTTEEIRTFILFCCGEKPPQGSISVLLKNRGLLPAKKERVNIPLKPGKRRGVTSLTMAYYNRAEVISAFKSVPYKSYTSRGRRTEVIDLEQRTGRKFNCVHYVECLDYATVDHIIDNKRVKKNFGYHKCDRYKKKGV